MKTTTWLWLYKLLGRLPAMPQEVLFSVEEPPPRRLLFLFPTDADRFRTSLRVFHHLERYPDGEAIQLAVPVSFQDQIPASNHGVFYFPLTRDKVPTVDVAVLLARYKEESFDAVVNLDPEITRHMAQVIHSINAPKRIGFSALGADDIYNIQIDPEEPDLLDGSYDQMLAICDLGTPNKPEMAEA